VRVATDPAVAGANVYLKAFDPDDPSAKNNEVDADLDGGDNRDDTHGDTGELSTAQTVTDASGEAAVQFRLAHQPGDNHRVAASLKQSALDTLTDNNVPPSATDPGTEDQVDLFIGHISPLLTVWRTLTVERDTMAAPEYGATWVYGTVAAVIPNSPVAGQSEIDLGQNLADEFSDLNLYEEGEIVFAACPGASNTFDVFLSTSETWPWHDWVSIVGVPGACANGSAYTLKDDDDTGVLPQYPDGGQLLLDAYGQAYILPVYAGAAYQDVLGFDLHVGDWDGEYGWGPWDDGQDLTSSPAFWSCLVVGCWESGQNDDGDPDYCFYLFPPYVEREGAEVPTTGKTDDDSGASMIFLQGIADQVACTHGTDEAHTVTHEIGHTCGSHPQHIPDSIMETGAPRTQSDFAPESIRIFREQDQW